MAISAGTKNHCRPLAFWHTHQTPLDFHWKQTNRVRGGGIRWAEIQAEAKV
jgi:hypothetical protein